MILYRPLIARLAQDAIAEWLRRATGLPIYFAESGSPRPELPYVAFEFPRGRPKTQPLLETDLSETIGTTEIVVTAVEGGATTLYLNAARFSLRREAGEALETFVARIAAEAAYWLRGRATVAAGPSALTLTPVAPGTLFRTKVLEGAIISDGEPGPPARFSERIYLATCRVEILGAPLAGAANPGEVGDGLDTYTIEASITESLSKYPIRRLLRAGYLIPVATPVDQISAGSVISGSRREVRAYFDLGFAWSGFYVSTSEAVVSIELDLFTPDDTPLGVLSI